MLRADPGQRADAGRARGRPHGADRRQSRRRTPAARDRREVRRARASPPTPRRCRITPSACCGRRSPASRTATTRFEDRLDDDGFSRAPIAIRVRVRIAGDGADRRLHRLRSADHRRRQRQLRHHAVGDALRLPLPGPRGRALQRRHRPRPCASSRRRARIVNAVRPSAVAGGNVETSQRITDVVLRRARAGAAGAAARRQPGHDEQRHARRPASGAPASRSPTTRRSAAAWAARPGLDGISGVHTHMSNTRNTPIEAIEHYLPVRVRQYAIRPGSGGAGRWRGGDGIVREYEALTETEVTVLSDRRVGAPYGAQGGAPGAVGPQHADPRRRRDGRCRQGAPDARARRSSAHRVAGRRWLREPDVSDGRHRRGIAGPVRLVARRDAGGPARARRRRPRLDARRVRRDALGAGPDRRDGALPAVAADRRPARVGRAARLGGRRHRLRRHRRSLRPDARR